VNTQSIRAKPSHAQGADKKCPVDSSEEKEPSRFRGVEYGMKKTHKPRSNTNVKTIEKFSHV
jgi:hypothetical protein